MRRILLIGFFAAMAMVCVAATWTAPTADVIPVKFGIYDTQKIGTAPIPRELAITYVKDADFFVGIGRHGSPATISRDYNLRGFERGVHVTLVVEAN